MNKEFVPYKQALVLRELGFDEDCFGHYEKEELFIELTTLSKLNEINKTPIVKLTKNIWMLAPTYQQAFKWFREKHGIYNAIVKYSGSKLWWCDIERLDDKGKLTYKTNIADYTKYEDAEVAVLKRMIKLLKDD